MSAILVSAEILMGKYVGHAVARGGKYCFKMSSDESVVSSEMLIRLFLRKVRQLKFFLEKKKELYYLEEKQSSLRRHIMHGS